MRNNLWPVLGWCICVSVSLGALWSVWFVSASMGLFFARTELLATGMSKEGTAIPYQLSYSDCATPSLLRAVQSAPSFWEFQRAAGSAANPLRHALDISRLSPPDRRTVSSALSKVIPANLAVDLREASLCPPPRFDRDYLSGPEANPGPMPVVAEVGQMLAVQAILLGLEGEQVPARVLLETCSNIARFGLADSLLVGWMSGANLDISSVTAAQSILSASESIDDGWRDLAEMWRLRQKEVSITLLHATENEALYSGLWTFGNALRGDASPFLALGLGVGLGEWVPSIYSSLLLPMLLSDFAEYLNFTARLRASLNPSSPSYQKTPYLTSPYAILSTPLAAYFEDLPVRAGEYLARLRLGHVGIELELYRQAHGEYPHRLSDLGLPQSDTQDPFSSAELIYRPHSNGVLLYSVGANGTDESGRERSRSSSDLVWKIKRTAP